MKVSISPAARSAFPDLNLFVVQALDVQIPALARDVDAQVVRWLPDTPAWAQVDPLSKAPQIAAFRALYSAMGLKPSKYLSSVEALTKRLLKTGFPSTGVALVDAYNAASIAFGAPMGAFDLDLAGNAAVELRFANVEQDAFDPLGGDAASFPLNEKMIVYATQSTVISWGLNHRDSKDFAVSDQTRNVAFLAEHIGDSGQADQALTALAEYLSQFSTVSNVEQIV